MSPKPAVAVLIQPGSPRPGAKDMPPPPTAFLRCNRLGVVGNQGLGAARRRPTSGDRTSVVWGKSGSVRVDLGVGRIIKKNKPRSQEVHEVITIEIMTHTKPRANNSLHSY